MRKVKTKTPPAISPLLLVIGIALLGFLGYRLLSPRPNLDINQVTGGTGTLTLALTPAVSTQAAGSNQVLTLTIDTGSSRATAIQAEISYPPDKCKPPVLTQGDFFTQTIVPPTIVGGTIKFSYVVPTTSGGKPGTGTVATISTGPTTGPCTLTFTSNTIVTAIGISTNALASASDATINLAGQVTPTPVPTSLPPATGSCPPKYTPAQCQEYLAKRSGLLEKVRQFQACLVNNKMSYCLSHTQ